ncbi:MAG: TolC family protein [Proteobacteria bacterium]|nr:TolC family protein [Pseudomonadota bacterium]
MMRFTLFLLISAVGLCQVFAADVEGAPKPIHLTLDECIKRAVANSRTLMAERHRLEALEAQVKQVFWAPFSNISIGGFGTLVPDKCVDKKVFEEWGRITACGDTTLDEYDYSAGQDWGPKLEFKAGFGIPLYTFNKISSAQNAVKQARAAKEAEYPRFVHQIKFQVEQAYQAISGAREMLYTIEQGRKHLKKARDKVEKDLENQEGTSTEIDLIKLKVFQIEVDQYETQAHEIEHVGLSALHFLVGGDDRERVDIVDKPQERTKEEIESLENYKQSAIEHRPELKALKHAVKAMEAKVDMRRADFWPDLLLVGGFTYGWTPGRTDLDGAWVLKDNYNYGPGFGFGLALSYKLDIGLDIYRLKEARAELAALTADQKAALDGVMLEVDKAYHQTVAARDALAAMEKSRRLVKGWISAVMQNHAAGLGSAKEVKDALAEYFKVMASIHKLTHDYNVRMAEIQRVTGVSQKDE